MTQTGRKSRQYVFMAFAAFLLVLAVLVLGTLLNRSPANQPVRSDAGPVESTLIRDRISAASPEMTWITSGRAELQRLSKEIEEQRKLVDEARRAAEAEISTIRETYDEQILQQAVKITELEDALAMGPVVTEGGAGSGARDPQSLSATFGPSGHRSDADAGQTADISAGSDEQDFIERRKPSRQSHITSGAAGTAAQAGSGFGVKFNLVSPETTDADLAGEARAIHRLGNYLPAGSYAPAIVLSGADAATNVANREDPIPVLFRITGPAHTAAPHGSRPAKVNLRGCTVQGSATGDLSSERVKVRLISMTCINPAGEVLETRVSGYMAGSGKEGVRGQVTSREGRNVSNAAIAGALGGIGEGISAAGQAAAGSETANVQQILKGAAARSVTGGVQQAASSLAEYYIRRAEQYQSVVSLYGGTGVELVFLEGVELGA